MASQNNHGLRLTFVLFLVVCLGSVVKAGVSKAPRIYALRVEKDMTFGQIAEPDANGDPTAKILIIYYNLQMTGTWSARSTPVTGANMKARCEQGKLVYYHQATSGPATEAIDKATDDSERSRATPIYGPNTTQHLTCYLPGMPLVEDDYAKVTALGLAGYILTLRIFQHDDTCTDHQNIVAEVYTANGYNGTIDILGFTNVNVPFPHVHTSRPCVSVSSGDYSYFMRRAGNTTRQTLDDTMSSRSIVPIQGTENFRPNALTTFYITLTVTIIVLKLSFASMGPIWKSLFDPKSSIS